VVPGGSSLDDEAGGDVLPGAEETSMVEAAFSPDPHAPRTVATATRTAAWHSWRPAARQSTL
jgi:hypothetical protein